MMYVYTYTYNIKSKPDLSEKRKRFPQTHKQGLADTVHKCMYFSADTSVRVKFATVEQEVTFALDEGSFAILFSEAQVLKAHQLTL